MRAILCKTDGSQQDIVPLDGKEFTIGEMYELIGCDTVEHLGLVKGVHLWCDENGRFAEDAKVNPVATKYFLKAFPPETHLFPGGIQDIVGNAIIIDNTRAGWLSK